MAKMLLLVFMTGLTAIVNGQDFSNKGKEFWLGYGNHQQMYTSSWPGMDIYITSDVNTRVTVDIPGMGITIGVFDIVANQITTISNVTTEAFLLREGISDKGIHIVAEKPVVVYAHIYFSSVSGATLCLPVSTLGREYYSVNFEQRAQSGSTHDSAHSYFFVVATEDNTTIEITPAANSLSNALVAGQTYTRVLNKGQVFNMLARSDLTGSVIRSVNTGTGCKKIAVFSGSGRIGIGCGNSISSSDNLFQQMYPNSTWGKKYLTVPSLTRPQNFYRIIRPDPATVVKLDGSIVPGAFFSNNFYYQFDDGQPHVIEADKPILVAQYFTTQNCGENTNNGDPEMIYLNPVEQTINRVTLTSMNLVSNANVMHFINAIVKNSPAAINTFTIDGAAYAGSFRTHPSAPEYAYAQIPVNFGTHTILCDTPFNAIAYGFSRTESYGYSAGTNLKDLYQFVSIQNNFTTINFPASCKNSTFKIAMTFPYEPTQLKWIFGPALNALGIRDSTILNPVADSSWIVDGRTLYRYRLNKSYQVGTPGSYTVLIKADNPTSDGCSGEQEIEYDLQIFEKPAAAFTYTHNGCLTDSVAFADNTNGFGRPVVNWYWDFGDGAVPADGRNVKYKYQSAGPMRVRHAAITDIGCVSDTAETIIPVAEPPVADFALLSPPCENSVINFAERTINAGDPLVSWTWHFGDGASTNATNNNPVPHTYATPGDYPVSLQVATGKGCTSTVFMDTISIHYLPVPKFGVPEVCVDDAFAEFIDSSTISDNSEPQFSWAWDFGDNGTATQKNPRHKYLAAGNYTVNLQVTSNNGCARSVSLPFTVNGRVQQANFLVDARDALCANEVITLHDATVIESGRLSKVIIYWDYANDPTNQTVDNEPAQGKTYTHKYPDFALPATKTFRVLYEAYTGMACSKTATNNIIVRASPVITFDPMQPVCEEIGPFLLTAAKEIYGFSGTGLFSGPGISPTGIFNPKAATPGLHTIRYHFTADNGCTDSKEQTIRVDPTPTADAGPDKGVLPDGIVTLQGRGTGNNIQYSWTPVLAMNNPTRATPVVSPKEDTYYTLTVTSTDGCVATDEVFVKFLNRVVVPNAFSPNGDGINDTWVVLFLDSYPGCSVDVFNRYGQKVFSSTGYGKNWDGTVNGNPLPVGTYYWIINPRNGKPQLNGTVTIVR